MEIQMNAKPEDLQGKYANFIAVTSQERDVVIDFASVMKMGNQPAAGQLVARIFLNRYTAEELMKILKENLERWEKMRYENPGQPNAT
jgi:hypothetical protein